MSEWTINTLKEYLEETLRQRDIRLEQRFISQQDAVQTALVTVKLQADKIDSETDKKFASVNEFRGLVKDTQATYITRSEVLAKIDTLSEQINAIKEAMTLLQGTRNGINAVWVYALGAAALGGFLIKVFFP